MLAKLYSNTVPVVKSSELKDWKAKQNLTILDTREPNEFGVSQIEGALVVGYDNIDWSKIDPLNPNDTIVVYCSVGYRSERIGEQLLKKGFKQVYNLYGGIFDWVNNGNPVYLANEQTPRVHGYSKSWGKWLTKGEKVYD
ncbi:MAG: rhodanese-like domain-containing protein [Aureispira sp.]|nr:rhodanese-like domain-containing protein [Aureispira sp.]